MPVKKTKSGSNNFLVQGAIFAVAGILVRLIGLAYRVPLLRIIGSEGMGYYSTQHTIYMQSFFCCPHIHCRLR